MDLGVKGWNGLGVVGTIYEEEDEDSSSTVASVPSPEFTPSPPSHQFYGSESWTYDPDVVIHVQDSSFSLHKDALISRSGYLKRQLNKLSEITLSPPLNITAETFSLVTDFCYGTYVFITPFNVAALRTAAELLEMTVITGARDENLQQKTEDYFCRAVTVNKESSSIVMRSCFPLLPEAETTASLVSRCIEALSVMGEVDGDMRCLDDVTRVGVADLQLILESMSQRLTDCHDLLYRIIDLYVKENHGKVSEDQKTRMCNYIDCSILSHRHLMHAVQNPRMPLRFVVQAMFLEQLHTRRSIIDNRSTHTNHQVKDPITLGAILQRDAALRQVAQLKGAMSVTHSRIQTLEKELTVMKKILNESESIGKRVDSERSASFRFSSEGNNKVERGQIGSVSDLSTVRRVGKIMVEKSSSSEESSDGSRGVEKGIGKRFMSGLKSAFGLGSKKKCEGPKWEMKLENEDLVVIKKDQGSHKLSRSKS